MKETIEYIKRVPNIIVLMDGEEISLGQTLYQDDINKIRKNQRKKEAKMSYG